MLDKPMVPENSDGSQGVESGRRRLRTERRLASMEKTLLMALPCIDEAAADKLLSIFGTLKDIQNLDPTKPADVANLANEIAAAIGLSNELIPTDWIDKVTKVLNLLRGPLGSLKLSGSGQLLPREWTFFEYQQRIPVFTGLNILLEFAATGSFAIGYEFNIDGVNRMATGEIGPEIVNTMSGSAALDVFVARGGVTIDVKILYNTLKVFAELKLDKWPIDVTGGLRRVQQPLHVQLSAWYETFTKVKICCEMVLGAEVCLPCGLTWSNRKSIPLVGWDIPANGQPIEDTLLEISSVEPNEAPEVTDSTISTDEDTGVRGTCIGTDPNGNKMLFSLVHTDGPFKVEIVNPNIGTFKVEPTANRHERYVLSLLKCYDVRVVRAQFDQRGM
jgi:hypothetical protein